MYMLRCCCYSFAFSFESNIIYKMTFDLRLLDTNANHIHNYIIAEYLNIQSKFKPLHPIVSQIFILSYLNKLYLKKRKKSLSLSFSGNIGKSKEAEIKRINKELANIRSKFKGDKTLDGYQKKKYVCKLLFIFLLGHDIDFGHMEAVNLLSSNKYSEKQIVSINKCNSLFLIPH